MVVASIAILSLLTSLMSDGLLLSPSTSPEPPEPPEPPPPSPPPPGSTWMDLVPTGYEDILHRMPSFLAATGTGVAWWLAKNHMYKRLGILVEEKMAQYALENPGVWRLFWKKAVARLGVRGAAAAVLVGMDGPLPIGDLIAVGLTIWMLYDLYQLLVEVFESTEGYGLDASRLGMPATGNVSAVSQEMWNQMALRMPEILRMKSKGVARDYITNKLEKKLELFLLERAVKSKSTWKLFWTLASRKLAVRGTVAVAMAAVDGPLPIGDMLGIGMSLWTIYDLLMLWNEIWNEVDRQEQRGVRYGLARIKGHQPPCEAMVRYMALFPRPGYDLEELAKTYSKADADVQTECALELSRLIHEDAKARGIPYHEQLQAFARARKEMPDLPVAMTWGGGRSQGSVSFTTSTTPSSTAVMMALMSRDSSRAPSQPTGWSTARSMGQSASRVFRKT